MYELWKRVICNAADKILKSVVYMNYTIDIKKNERVDQGISCNSET